MPTQSRSRAEERVHEMDIQNVVQTQYLAALKMLKEVILKCPPSVWDATAGQGPILV